LYNLANIMPDASALQKYYQTLTDDELLNLKSEGGFTGEAEQVLELLSVPQILARLIPEILARLKTA
jgi:hypothetical protein